MTAVTPVWGSAQLVPPEYRLDLELAFDLVQDSRARAAASRAAHLDREGCGGRHFRLSSTSKTTNIFPGSFTKVVASAFLQ